MFNGIQEFVSWKDLEVFCKQSKLTIIKSDNFSIKARLKNENNFEVRLVYDKTLPEINTLKSNTEWIIVWT